MVQRVTSPPVEPTDGNEPKGPKYADLQSLGRAMAILEAVAETPMRPTDIAERLGLKWATAYRSIKYLREQGFLAREARGGKYRIGPRLYYVGSSYVRDLPLLEASRSYMKEAVDRTGTAAQLVERQGDNSVVLFAIESQTILLPQATIGYHFPLHCGSKGHVLLAHTSPAFIDRFLAAPLRSFTPHTITDPQELRRRLDEVRDQGFAETVRDIRPTTASVAAPIRDVNGVVTAAITLITSASTFEEHRARLIEIVVEIAQTVSQADIWSATSSER